MRNLLLLLAILLALGMIFARDRVKRAFQLGALLYGVVLIVRFVIFGFGDSDNLLDLLTIGVIFFLVWLAAWAGTQAVLKYRARSNRPPS